MSAMTRRVSSSRKANDGGCVKKEIREANKDTRARIKELKEEDAKLQGSAEEIARQIQESQQKIAQINTERLKKIGAIEELEKQVRG